VLRGVQGRWVLGDSVWQGATWRTEWLVKHKALQLSEVVNRKCEFATENYWCYGVKRMDAQRRVGK